LSDDQLFIKALEEFKPSVYGENYEEENENATHEKGYNASKKRKQAIEEFAFNKASYYDWDKLADDEKPQIWAIGKKLINRGKKTLKPEHSFVHVIRKHDVDAFNTLCQMGGILEDVLEVNKNAAGVNIECFVNDVSSDAALDETMIHDLNEDVSSQLHEDLNGKDNEDDGTVKHNDDIESTTNDQLNAQIDQKVEQNEEVVPKCFNPSSGSTSTIYEPKVERRPFDDKLSESVADSFKIRERKYDDKPLNKESEPRPVIFNLQENLSLQLPCLTSKMIQNLKKPPFLIPDMTLLS
ncbi:hypothetical protein Tco_1462843, partial [Tanacetum coccineum]